MAVHVKQLESCGKLAEDIQYEGGRGAGGRGETSHWVGAGGLG